MAMSFMQASRAENPDLANALAQQTDISNQLKAGENQAKMQNRNSNLMGGAMLAQAAPEGTFWGASGAEGAAIDQGLANATGTITPAASAAEGAALAGDAALAGEAAAAGAGAAGAAGAGAGAGAGGAATAAAGMTPIGWGALGLLAANQFGLLDFD